MVRLQGRGICDTKAIEDGARGLAMGKRVVRSDEAEWDCEVDMCSLFRFRRGDLSKIFVHLYIGANLTCAGRT